MTAASSDDATDLSIVIGDDTPEEGIDLSITIGEPTSAAVAGINALFDRNANAA